MYHRHDPEVQFLDFDLHALQVVESRSSSCRPPRKDYNFIAQMFCGSSGSISDLSLQSFYRFGRSSSHEHKSRSSEDSMIGLPRRNGDQIKFI